MSNAGSFGYLNSTIEYSVGPLHLSFKKPSSHNNNHQELVINEVGAMSNKSGRYRTATDNFEKQRSSRNSDKMGFYR